MLIELLCVSSMAVSGGALLQSFLNNKRASASAKSAAASAERAQRSATSSRAHSLAALSHARSSQRACEKSEASASRSADNANAFLLLMQRVDSGNPPRTRGEVYEQIAQETAAKENKEAIASASAEARPPTWLKRWAKPAA